LQRRNLTVNQKKGPEKKKSVSRQKQPNEMAGPGGKKKNHSCKKGNAAKCPGLRKRPRGGKDNVLSTPAT